ncbi:hypothetical protein LGM65_04120 [Burkholderia anthina]|uniref:hypothetical protein n=1 Tax=Burkholderia anthina TaxID=179879 RepID=UPI001CF5565F|nr:hypothetical protein [Burkholderia anthina]MCA8090084.1 hypothetical protein [Burkholderia anthina]
MACSNPGENLFHHSSSLRALHLVQPLFRFGQIVATRGVLTHLEHHGIAADPYLKCHVCGDWGMVPPEDARANCLAVQHGARILSSYDIVGKRCRLSRRLIAA